MQSELSRGNRKQNKTDITSRCWNTFRDYLHLFNSNMGELSGNFITVNGGHERKERKKHIPAMCSRSRPTLPSNLAIPRCRFKLDNKAMYQDWRKFYVQSDNLVPRVLSGNEVGRAIVLAHKAYCFEGFSWQFPIRYLSSLTASFPVELKTLTGVASCGSVLHLIRLPVRIRVINKLWKIFGGP